MEANNFDFFVLEQCKAMVQKQLGWEDSTSWTNSDFLKLSEIIYEKTSVRLSSATLKRIWGKVRYENKPTITTLNTLAQYVNYADWRAFKQSLAAMKDLETAFDSIQENHTVPTTLKTKTPRWHYRKSIRMGVIVGLLVFVTIIITGIASSVDEKTKNYSFSSKMIVSEGVPNSVVFDYDATSSPVDSVVIQQSWDERLRTKVSKHDHQHTSIYYTPGFFKAKLVVNNDIVREHNLWITSNGWIALVKQAVIPVYFDKQDFTHDGVLSLSISKLTEKNIAFQPETPWTSYYNVKDFGDIKTDAFEFSTRVRSDFKQGSGVCQRIQILLLTDGNVIIIPLSIKGCVSDLDLVFGDEISGKKKDLSAFGADVSEFVNVRCEVKNKIGKIFINDSLAYQNAYNSSEKIVGMIFRFEGTGSIDEVSLTDQHGVKVLDDLF
jgi:hypothetical protein